MAVKPRSASSERSASAPERAADSGASSALWVALGSLAIARLVASAVPGSWGWGLASLGFVPPAAWGLWALATLALAPRFARGATSALEAIGDAWMAPMRRAWPALTLLAIAAGALVWWLSDRGYFVGDFVLRLGIIRMNVPYARMFPQALPLDALIHERWIGSLASITRHDPLELERALGVARAAALALLGALLARSLGRRGAGAVAITIAAAATGALGLCTGYAKGLADFSLCVMAAGVLGIRVARGLGGFVALGLVTALAIMLHRSGFALLVPWLVAAGLARRRGQLSWARWGTWVGLGLPALAALAMAPRVLWLLTNFDPTHLAPGGSGALGALAAAFEPHHLCDAANAIAWTSPLAFAALALALVRPRVAARLPEAVFLAALVAPWLLELLFVHPRQGMVRDWDVFVPASVAVAIAAACWIGAALEATPARLWLAVPVVLAAAAPIGSLLLRAHDDERSLAFARAVIEGPPIRSALERASLHQYRGIVLGRDRRYAECAEEFREAAELVPSPTYLSLLVDTALLAHEWAMARDALAELADRAPTPPRLLQLSRLELALRHVDAAREAARRALEIAPQDSASVAWAESLGVTPAPLGR